MASFERQRALSAIAVKASIIGAIAGAGIGVATGGWLAMIGVAIGLGAVAYGGAWGYGLWLIRHDEQQRLKTLRKLPFKQGLTIQQSSDRVSILTHEDKALIYIRQSEDMWIEIAVANQRRDGKAFQMTTVMSSEAALARSLNTHFVGWEVLDCRIAGVKLERRGKLDFVAALASASIGADDAGAGDGAVDDAANHAA